MAESLFSQDKNYYGPYRQPVNFNLRIVNFTPDSIRDLVKQACLCSFKPLVIYPAPSYGTGKSLNDCLTEPCDPSSKKPPPVSKISSRIKLEFSGSKDYEIGLYNMLKIDPCKLNDDLLVALCKDLASVHIAVEKHFSKLRMSQSSSTINKEEINGKELFMDILLLVLHPPLAAHLECETVLSDVASESDRLLPIAKFDMIISTQGKDQRNEIMIKINGNTSIESTLSVSSKTEKSVNQRLPNSQVALETLIFSEICHQKVAKVILGSQSIIRPQLYVAKADVLLTTSGNIVWCSHQSSGEFEIFNVGVIAFLLIVKSGTSVYPDFDDTFLQILDSKYPCCGWRDEYQCSDVKYVSLKQHKSTPPVSKVHSSQFPSLEVLKPLEDYLTLPQKRMKKQ